MTELEQKIRAEKIRLIYHQGPVLVFGSTFCALIITIFLWRSLPQSGLLIWMGSLAVTCWLRYQVIRAYHKADAATRLDSNWGPYFWCGTLVAGVIWGVWPLMFYDQYNTEFLLLISTIFAGMVAVSAASGGIYLPSFLSFSVPLILPLCIVHLRSDTDSLQLTGGLLMMFLAVNYFLASRGSRQTDALLRAQFQNQDLLDRLADEKATAERAVVAKSRFLAAASHDLRQPLHAMGLFLSALKRRENNPEQLSIINEMSQSADALNGLFNSLLDVSRLDAEIIDFNPDHYRLHELFDRVRATFIQQAEAKGLELVVNASSNVVYTDAILLERVLRNLVANAVKYTDSGRISLVSLSDAAGNPVITLSDTGIGIPLEERDNVFTEYHQLDNPERDRGKGLGLGLSIVRRLCDLMDIPLTMESTVGVGTIFRLTIPAGDPLQVGQGIDPANRPEGALSSDPTILVIDDEKTVLSSMRTTLQDFGCNVLLAESAREALKVMALGDSPPSVVVSDYRLRGDHNGVDAVSVVRESLGRDIPGVIVTADTSPEKLRELVDSGLHVLHKPVRSKELHEVLRSVLENTPNLAA